MQSEHCVTLRRKNCVNGFVGLMEKDGLMFLWIGLRKNRLSRKFSLLLITGSLQPFLAYIFNLTETSLCFPDIKIVVVGICI